MQVRRGVCGVMAMLAVSAWAQTPATPLPISPPLVSPPPPALRPDLPRGISRVAGNDDEAGIAYALISVEGRLALPAGLPAPEASPALGPARALPRLTAQCTQKGESLKYELLVDFGEIPELVFLPPWRPRKEQQVQPPITHVKATLDFIGYTKVKPAKREFDLLQGRMAGVMVYSTPGLHTSNLEPVAYYMQFLKALPTLRVTVPGRGVVEFDTLPWQAVVRAEPLCRMASL